MSGGEFQYAYSRVLQFAEDLRERLADPEEDFTIPTDNLLREIEQVAVLTAKLMREVEWLYSADTSEREFRQAVTDIIAEAEGA